MVRAPADGRTPRRRFLRSVALSTFLLLVTGCFDAADVDLTIAHDAEPATLDPALMTSVGDARIAAALFAGLARLDPETLTPVPDEAESWTVSPDGLAWTFSLRPDARWSDGRPVTAGDFRRSWLRLLDPRTGAPYATLLFPVEGAAAFHRGEAGEEEVGLYAPDHRTLVVRLAQPTPWFPALAASFPLLPVRIDRIQEHGERWTRPGRIVGNGPFVLESHRFHREVVLARAPGRPAPKGTARRIRIIPVSDPNTQLNLFLTGGVDLAFSVPADAAAALRPEDGLRSTPQLATTFLRLNTTRPPGDRPRFRAAVVRAVDRATLVRVAAPGDVPATRLLPPVLAGPPIEAPTFDPAAARRLMATSPEPDGGSVALLVSHNPDQIRVATVLQAMLREHLGLSVALDVREWKVYLKAMRELDYDLALSRWIGDYPDPTTFLDCFRDGSGNNRTGYADPEFDGLLDAAAAVPAGDASTDRRSDLLRRAEEHLLAAAPIVVLTHPATRCLVSPRIREFRPNPLGIQHLGQLQIRLYGE